MRPDTLLWEITDWSGGEGFRVYDAEGARCCKQHWRLVGVDAFTLPGKLSPSPETINATDDGDPPSDLTTEILMVGLNNQGELLGISLESGTDGIKVWAHNGTDH